MGRGLGRSWRGCSLATAGISERACAFCSDLCSPPSRSPCWPLAATAVDGRAADSKIVYACRPNLCVVDPATGISSPLTSDGTEALPYLDPSLSADGTRLAARRGGDVLVGAATGNLGERWGGSPQGLNDVALSPDGTAVAESHAYVQNVNRVRCYPFAGCQLELVLEDMSGTTWSQRRRRQSADERVLGRRRGRLPRRRPAADRLLHAQRRRARGLRRRDAGDAGRPALRRDRARGRRDPLLARRLA